jgi:hypothetical protein
VADALLLVAGAFVAAMVAAGFGAARTSSTTPARPPSGEPPSRERALRVFLVTLAVASLGAFGSAKWAQVTQKRQGKGYSNCGDLIHALLWWAGCRSKHVNRTEPGRTWKATVNISELVALGVECGGWTAFPEPSAFEPGDVLLLGEFNAHEAEHVGIVKRRVGNVISTADYGQAGQGGGENERTFQKVAGKWRSSDGRRLVGRLDVSRLALSAPPVVPPEMVSEATTAARDDLARTQGVPNA